MPGSTRLASLPVVLAAACVATPAGVQAQRLPITFAPTRAVLVLIPGAEATQALAEHRPASIDATSAAEADLVRDCANGESQRAQVSKGVLWSAAAQAWRILLHPLAVSVHEELLKYASVSDATASGDYYRAGDSTGGAAPVNSRISCLRFTRFTSAEPAAEEVALDFVASVRLDSARDAIRLRPLRLFISQAAARSANGRYSVAIALRADAVWRDEFAGHHAQVFEQTLAGESVDLKSGSYLKYYPTDATSGTRVPIIPMSFGADRSRDFGRAEFGVSVAELGTPPATLKLLAEMLPDPDEKLGQLVIAAAVAGARTR
jgi:hypothetical protein